MNCREDHPFCDYPAWKPPLDLELQTSGQHPCSYLPQQQAQTRYLLASGIDGASYQKFMDAGFRRSGHMIYQPVCQACRACLPLRVPVDQFAKNKSQRRCLKRNADLSVTCGELEFTDEKYELYARYQEEWHQGDSTPGELEEFLYDSPTDSLEFEYRDPQGTLLAIGICDFATTFLSSVYFYFDPRHADRGLGTFGALQELQFASRVSMAHYYLGYWVQDCRAMTYKANFRPCEALHPDGIWRPIGSCEDVG